MAKRRNHVSARDDDLEGTNGLTEAIEAVGAAAPEGLASAAARFAELEERLFGDRCARVDGQIERGHGSLFRALSPEDRAAYLALEREVEAEAAVAAAQATLSAAQAQLAVAEGACEKLKADQAAAAEKSEG